ncbi:MAG TPA: EAL domain-containing protein [Candidatus Baltobacteraceae bacterium]|nr:EAL domain-containing protein [Candidatus Baltobacteraceae bacterium]
MNAKVALVGPGATRARDVLAALAQGGFQGRAFLRIGRMLESRPRWDAVVMLASEGQSYTDEDLAGLRTLAASRPVIVACERIDMNVVRYAAGAGAYDVVLRSDFVRLRESIARAIGDWQNARQAVVPPDVRDDLIRHVFDLTPNCVSIRDGQGRYVIVSQAFADLYGVTVDEMTGKPIAAFTRTAAEADEEIVEDLQVLTTRRSRFVERHLVDGGGVSRVLQIVKRPLVLANGPAYVMAVGVDVTVRTRAEAALEKTNEFLKNVLESITDAVFSLDLSGKFALANQRLTQITGYRHHELIGMPFEQIFTVDAQSEVQRMLAHALNELGKERRFEAHVAHADGHQRTITCSLHPLAQGDRITGVVGTASDVTDRKIAEQRIEHLAYHDPLTNLPNRRLLSDRLAMAMSQAKRDRRMVAVLFVDLDRFKSINDSLGHRTGDLVLAELGTRLRACVRAGDTVARMGGDEFVFLLPAIESIDEVHAVAHKVLAAIRQPFAIEGREFVVTACAGVALYPNHAADADTLIKHADTALFECKRHAGDTYVVFDESMSARSMDYFILENDLRRAIAQGELELHYQPIVEMRTERIVALEALLRWRHPEKGLLHPESFISLAEETGLVNAMGDWVLREACRQNSDWQRRGIFQIPVAVNISARQFDGDVLSSVAGALAGASLDATYLELELTETILMESAASSSSTIDALKDLGVRISIDDFGTGYSSLSYLDRYPIDALKIDRSFMPMDPSAPGAGVIAGTIISMAQSLGIGVIAEGVETSAQRDFVLSRGCTRAQGHYYWAAMRPEDIEALTAGDARDRVLA